MRSVKTDRRNTSLDGRSVQGHQRLMKVGSIPSQPPRYRNTYRKMLLQTLNQIAAVHFLAIRDNKDVYKVLGRQMTGQVLARFKTIFDGHDVNRSASKIRVGKLHGCDGNGVVRHVRAADLAGC